VTHNGVFEPLITWAGTIEQVLNSLSTSIERSFVRLPTAICAIGVRNHGLNWQRRPLSRNTSENLGLRQWREALEELRGMSVHTRVPPPRDADDHLGVGRWKQSPFVLDKLRSVK